MKKGLTELVYILDRSGSMAGLELDTIGGYNAFLEKQKSIKGEATITTVLFDDRIEYLHEGVSLQDADPISGKDYFVRGTTALLDAIGQTVTKVKAAQKDLKKKDRAEKVMFVITTDGMENASREYSYDKVKALVEKQKEKHGWEFIFIGANIDAIETAGRFGIASDRAVDYHADKVGTKAMYEAINDVTFCIRSSTSTDSFASCSLDDWKEKIEADNKSRV